MTEIRTKHVLSNDSGAVMRGHSWIHPDPFSESQWEVLLSLARDALVLVERRLRLGATPAPKLATATSERLELRAAVGSPLRFRLDRKQGSDVAFSATSIESEHAPTFDAVVTALLLCASELHPGFSYTTHHGPQEPGDTTESFERGRKLASCLMERDIIAGPGKGYALSLDEFKRVAHERSRLVAAERAADSVTMRARNPRPL